MDMTEIPLDVNTSFVRASQRMRYVESQCRRVAPTDIPVLILGESGTGKEIAAKFIQNYKPQREHCWIAEREGEIVGCVLLVEHSKSAAKLRLLLVEPSARGLGLGRQLVEECIRFARLAGYRKITLWTNSVLLAARHLYQQAGFHLTREERHNSFGHDLVGETWELTL